MSDGDYDDRSRRRRGPRTRVPEYIETDETYIAKGPGYRQDLVLRSRDRDDDYYDDRRSYASEYTRRARSHGHRDRDDYYDDDAYSDYSRSRRGRRSSRYDDDNYSYYSEDDRRSRRKSGVSDALEGLGLGGVVAAITGKARSKSRRRSDDWDRRSERGYNRSRSQENMKKLKQAAAAAAAAGIIAAVRSRKDPDRTTRVATAALSAAGIDGILDRDPDTKSRRHIVESVIGGLVANRVANGPSEKRAGSRGRSMSRSRSRGPSFMERVRSRSQSVLGRGRSTSRGPGSAGGGSTFNTLKDVAAVGGVAAVGKAIYDRVRSKSRGRLRRDRSASSDDSYVPPRRQQYNQRRDERDVDDRSDDDDRGSRGRPAERDTDGEGQRDRSRSSSISTTDLEAQRKKTRGKELLTAGLATVATIHAAHGIYSSMVASEKRRKLVGEGEMSPEEARKRKTKNMLQDAAAVGIAALGIKSAYGEWKEMNESRKEKHEIEARHKRHQKARERRERERQLQLQGGWGSPPGGGMQPHYPDANPYGAYGGIPPPPGAGPPR